MKYFKNYPFTGKEDIQDIAARIYYEVILQPNFEIVEYKVDGKTSSVSYRKLIEVNIEYICNYHTIHYKNLNYFQIEEILTENVFKMTVYISGKSNRFFIYHLDKASIIKKEQWYDADYNLIHYEEKVYVDGVHTATKMFYPDSWNISIDKEFKF